ncbi:MAG: hypothetical protein QXW31_01615 [Nitrososphaerota archaeon]
MGEYWFKYGVTEVFADISDEVRVDKISTSYSSLKYDYSVISKIANEIAEGENIALIFDYSSSRDLDLLKSLIAELEAKGVEKNKFRILASSWRINRKILEKEIEEILKPYRGNIIYPWSESKVEYKGFMISRSIIDSQVKIYISTILPHGILGFPSISNSLKLSGWINGDIMDDSSYWFKLRDELDFMGVCIAGDNVYSGYLYEIENECLKNTVDKYTVKVDYEADILLVDGLGWPWDSTLEDSLHIVNLVCEGVREGGLIGLISECREGLGSSVFIKALLSKTFEEDTLGVKTLKKTMELLEKKKLAFVTTIPRSILEKTLNSRGFDTVQDLLTYAFRIYSKQAVVRIVDGTIRLIK